MTAEPAARSGPGPLIRALGRAVNSAVARFPSSWRLFRGPVRRFIDSVAVGWDERVRSGSAEYLMPLMGALDRLPARPARILDIGTGTGAAALEPPLVSFCPSRSSLTWSRMRRSQRFGVNVLGHHHKRFAQHATPAGADRFADLDWEPPRGGVPLLTDALATLECEAVAEHPTGDHWIVVGRIDILRIPPIKDPLIFFAGAFGALQQRT